MNILKFFLRKYLLQKRKLNSNEIRVTVLGAGSFGTVIANIIAENGHKTYLWTRNLEQVQFIKNYRKNPKYIKNIKLSKNIVPTCNLKEAFSKDVRCVFFAIPSRSFRIFLDEIEDFMTPNQYFVSMIKGLGDSKEFQFMSSILKEKLVNLEVYNDNIGVLCGPNLAIEIAKKQITGTVIASKNEKLIRFVQEIASCNYFHVFKSTDVIGVELGGILKNIYSIAIGICDGLNYGVNTKSFLLTKSLIEIISFGIKLGAKPMSFIGLAGVGDLIATSHSEYSRNYNFGYRIATSNKTATEIVENMNEVVEGMNTLNSVYLKALKLKLDMPILKTLYQIIHRKKNINSAISRLLLKVSVKNLDITEILEKK